MPSVFLAHSSRNKGFARRLAEHLRTHGIAVWLDEAELEIGDSLISRIGDAVENVDYLAVILSPHSVESEWVTREVQAALSHEISHRKVRVLPILWKRCSLPAFLTGKVYADLSTPSKYKRDFYRLVRKIKGIPSREEAEERLRDVVRPLASPGDPEYQTTLVAKEIGSKYYLQIRYTKSKKIQFYVLRAISRGRLGVKDAEWKKEEIYIHCSVPNEVYENQEGEMGGIILSPDNAGGLLGIDDNDQLCLTPAGKVVLRRLAIWVRRSIHRFWFPGYFDYP